MPAVWRLDLTQNPSLSPAVHFHHGLLAALAVVLATSSTAARALSAPADTSLDELVRLYRSESPVRAVEIVARWSRERVLSETRELLDAEPAPDRVEEPERFRLAVVAILTESALWHGSERTPGHSLAPRLRFAARLLQPTALRPPERRFGRRFYLVAGLALHWHVEIEAGHDLLREGLEIFPEDPELLTALGSIIETVASLSSHGTAAGAASPDHESGGYRAEARDRGGSVPGASLGQAASRYERALSKAPALAEARLRLGRVRLLQGRAADALAELERAAVDAHEPRQRYLVHLFESRAREELGDLDGAAAASRAALWHGGGTQTALLALGRHLDRRGDRTAAQRAFSRIGLPHAPFDPWWHYAAGQPERVDALVKELRELVR